MTEARLMSIAEEANVIVNGYALTLREDGFISILNLYHPDCAMVINKDCEIIETNMDPIEQQIVLELCSRNLQFIEC
ncbi:MAG: hypothetical protein IJI41_05020 [Anaerolineaceae bacterium]|nr:hypothetical protein [Anaerolineaceae bacterium]